MSVTEDVELYVAEAVASGGPVVELAVGTGRSAVPVAKAGISLIGVDQSSAMLARAREYAEREGVSELVDLRQGDLREPPVDERVPLVTVPFRSLLHMADEQEKLRALRAAVGEAQPLLGHAGPQLVAARQRPRQRRCPGEGRARAGDGDLSRGVDGLAALPIPPQPYAVEVLESEANGIDELVAPGAARVGGVLAEALPRGLRGVGITRRVVRRGGRRRQHLTQELLANETAQADA